MRLRRKVCLLGSTGVGKTSLVKRFAYGEFDDTESEAEGVMIHKRVIHYPKVELELLMWDLEGADGWSQYVASYMSGASGLVFVVDVTRPRSLEHVIAARDRAKGFIGRRPAVLVTNKIDMTSDWAIKKKQLDEANKYDWSILPASAKTGAHVDEVFEALAKLMMKAGRVAV